MLWPLDAATLATLVGGALTGAPSAGARDRIGPASDSLGQGEATRG